MLGRQRKSDQFRVKLSFCSGKTHCSLGAGESCTRGTEGDPTNHPGEAREGGERAAFQPTHPSDQSVQLGLKSLVQESQGRFAKDPPKALNRILVHRRDRLKALLLLRWISSSTTVMGWKEHIGPSSLQQLAAKQSTLSKSRLTAAKTGQKPALLQHLRRLGYRGWSFCTRNTDGFTGKEISPWRNLIAARDDVGNATECHRLFHTRRRRGSDALHRQHPGCDSVASAAYTWGWGSKK